MKKLNETHETVETLILRAIDYGCIQVNPRAENDNGLYYFQ
jgi:hypothetical protein